ncbi:MAG: tyrosine-type recombinase/integrase [Candidatus Thermoplasmatota archaeon]|nr:tyrosine-type recombinase/integrase [Candidatus Thermoplasmatota archaeon]
MTIQKKVCENEAVATFLDEFRSENTIANYKTALKSFFNFIGKNPDEYVIDLHLVDEKKRYATIKKYQEDVKSYWNHLMDLQKAPKTVTMHMAVLKVFFEFHEIDLPNKFWTERRRRGNGSKPVTRETPIDVKMLEKILIPASVKDRAILLCMSSSGARLCEILNLEGKDIDLDSSPVRIRIWEPKNKVPRVTYISNEAVKYLNCQNLMKAKVAILKFFS